MSGGDALSRTVPVEWMEDLDALIDEIQAAG